MPQILHHVISRNAYSGCSQDFATNIDATFNSKFSSLVVQEMPPSVFSSMFLLGCTVKWGANTSEHAFSSQRPCLFYVCVYVSLTSCFLKVFVVFLTSLSCSQPFLNCRINWKYWCPLITENHLFYRYFKCNDILLSILSSITLRSAI